MSIKIKKSKKGTFTKAAKARGKSVKEFENQVLTHRDNYSTAMRKKAQFSKNSKKWKKGENGLLIGDDPKIPTKDQNPYYGTEFPWDTKDLNPYYGTEMPEDDGGLTQRMPADKIEKYRGQAPIGTQINPNFRGNQPNVPPKKKIDLSNTIAGTLIAFDALLPKQKINRKYVRPEDQLSYNQNPYGTNSQAIFEDGGLLPKKKRKKSQNVVDDAIYTNGMQYSGTTESDNPTEEDWLKNMVEYAKNNWWETSNVYRPQFSHMTTNLDVQDINPTTAKKGARITIQSLKDGGKKKGKQPDPIITNNPNDPRLIAYQDSLRLYNEGEQEYQQVKATGKAGNKDPLDVDLKSEKSIPYDEFVEDYNHGNKRFSFFSNGTNKYIDPKSVSRWKGDGFFGFLDYANQARYKKPEQPVIYQRENPTMNAPITPVKKPVHPVVYQKKPIPKPEPRLTRMPYSPVDALGAEPLHGTLPPIAF